MSLDIARHSILGKALRMEANTPDGADDPEALRHAANNCRHMLQVLERKLAEADAFLREGEPDRCRQVLGYMQQAFPEVIAALDPGRHRNPN